MTLLGTFEERHHAVLREFMEAWLGRPVIHKHLADSQRFPFLHTGTVIYDAESKLQFIFVREEGRLKLATVICLNRKD